MTLTGVHCNAIVGINRAAHNRLRIGHTNVGPSTHAHQSTYHCAAPALSLLPPHLTHLYPPPPPGRRYGPAEGKYVLEGGSRCGRAEGLYVLGVSGGQGEVIHSAVEEAAQCRLQARRRLVRRQDGRWMVWGRAQGADDFRSRGPRFESHTARRGSIRMYGLVMSIGNQKFGIPRKYQNQISIWYVCPKFLGIFFVFYRHFEITQC